MKVLLSIKPEYAKVILQGKKQFEFRKTRCKEGIDRIIFYASSPQKEVVGEAEDVDVVAHRLARQRVGIVLARRTPPAGQPFTSGGDLCEEVDFHPPLSQRDENLLRGERK